MVKRRARPRASTRCVMPRQRTLSAIQDFVVIRGVLSMKMRQRIEIRHGCGSRSHNRAAASGRFACRRNACYLPQTVRRPSAAIMFAYAARTFKTPAHGSIAPMRRCQECPSQTTNVRIAMVQADTEPVFLTVEERTKGEGKVNQQSRAVQVPPGWANTGEHL